MVWYHGIKFVFYMCIVDYVCGVSMEEYTVQNIK